MESDWDFYLCSIEESPASVFLDLALRDHGPREDAAELIWVRVQMQRPRGDGLSSKDEMDSLCQLEDALCEVSDGTAGVCIYAGRTTFAGNRDFYFYCADRTLETAFAEMIRAKHDYSFEIGGRDDPDWQAYFRFLYPGAREFQMIQNQRVVRQLEEYGDSLEDAREVQHWIYFDNAVQRETFVHRLPRTGFVVSDEHDEGPEDRPYVVSVVKHHAVDVETVNDEVMRLFDLSCDCHGDYDGWETSVVTPQK